MNKVLARSLSVSRNAIENLKIVGEGKASRSLPSDNVVGKGDVDGNDIVGKDAADTRACISIKNNWIPSNLPVHLHEHRASSDMAVQGERERLLDFLMKGGDLLDFKFTAPCIQDAEVSPGSCFTKGGMEVSEEAQNIGPGSGALEKTVKTLFSEANGSVAIMRDTCADNSSHRTVREAALLPQPESPATLSSPQSGGSLVNRRGSRAADVADNALSWPSATNVPVMVKDVCDNLEVGPSPTAPGSLVEVGVGAHPLLEASEVKSSQLIAVPVSDWAHWPETIPAPHPSTASGSNARLSSSPACGETADESAAPPVDPPGDSSREMKDDFKTGTSSSRLPGQQKGAIFQLDVVEREAQGGDVGHSLGADKQQDHDSQMPPNCSVSLSPGPLRAVSTHVNKLHGRAALTAQAPSMRVNLTGPEPLGPDSLCVPVRTASLKEVAAAVESARPEGSSVDVAIVEFRRPSPSSLGACQDMGSPPTWTPVPVPVEVRPVLDGGVGTNSVPCAVRQISSGTEAQLGPAPLADAPETRDLSPPSRGAEGMPARESSEPSIGAVTRPRSGTAVRPLGALSWDKDGNPTAGTEADVRRSKVAAAARKAHQECILEEAEVIQLSLKEKMQWACLSPAVEAKRRKCHWDFVLEEMAWLANDYMQERLWKRVAAAQVSRAALEWKPRAKSRDPQRVLARSLCASVLSYWGALRASALSTGAEGGDAAANSLPSSGAVETSMAQEPLFVHAPAVREGAASGSDPKAAWNLPATSFPESIPPIDFTSAGTRNPVGDGGSLSRPPHLPQQTKARPLIGVCLPLEQKQHHKGATKVDTYAMRAIRTWLPDVAASNFQVVPDNKTKEGAVAAEPAGDAKAPSTPDRRSESAFWTPFLEDYTEEPLTYSVLASSLDAYWAAFEKKYSDDSMLRVVLKEDAAARSLPPRPLELANLPLFESLSALQAKVHDVVASGTDEHMQSGHVTQPRHHLSKKSRNSRYTSVVSFVRGAKGDSLAQGKGTSPVLPDGPPFGATGEAAPAATGRRTAAGNLPALPDGVLQVTKRQRTSALRVPRVSHATLAGHTRHVAHSASDEDGLDCKEQSTGDATGGQQPLCDAAFPLDRDALTVRMKKQQVPPRTAIGSAAMSALAGSAAALPRHGRRQFKTIGRELKSSQADLQAQMQSKRKLADLEPERQADTAGGSDLKQAIGEVPRRNYARYSENSDCPASPQGDARARLPVEPSPGNFSKKPRKGDRIGKKKVPGAQESVAWTQMEDSTVLGVVKELGHNWDLVSDVLGATLGLQGVFRPPRHCRERHRLLQARIADAGDPVNSDGAQQLQHLLSITGIANVQGSARAALLRQWEDSILKAHQSRLCENVQKHSTPKQSALGGEGRSVAHASHRNVAAQFCSPSGRTSFPVPLDLCSTGNHAGELHQQDLGLQKAGMPSTSDAPDVSLPSQFGHGCQSSGSNGGEGFATNGDSLAPLAQRDMQRAGSGASLNPILREAANRQLYVRQLAHARNAAAVQMQAAQGLLKSPHAPAMEAPGGSMGGVPRSQQTSSSKGASSTSNGQADSSSQEPGPQMTQPLRPGFPALALHSAPGMLPAGAGNSMQKQLPSQRRRLSPQEIVEMVQSGRLPSQQKHQLLQGLHQQASSGNSQAAQALATLSSAAAAAGGVSMASPTFSTIHQQQQQQQQQQMIQAAAVRHLASAQSQHKMHLLQQQQQQQKLQVVATKSATAAGAVKQPSQGPVHLMPVQHHQQQQHQHQHQQHQQQQQQQQKRPVKGLMRSGSTPLQEALLQQTSGPMRHGLPPGLSGAATLSQAQLQQQQQQNQARLGTNLSQQQGLRQLAQLGVMPPPGQQLTMQQLQQRRASHTAAQQQAQPLARPPQGTSPAPVVCYSGQSAGQVLIPGGQTFGMLPGAMSGGGTAGGSQGQPFPGQLSGVPAGMSLPPPASATPNPMWRPGLSPMSSGLYNLTRGGTTIAVPPSLAATASMGAPTMSSEGASHLQPPDVCLPNASRLPEVPPGSVFPSPQWSPKKIPAQMPLAPSPSALPPHHGDPLANRRPATGAANLSSSTVTSTSAGLNSGDSGQKQ